MIGAEVLGDKLLVTRLGVLKTDLIKRVDDAIGVATLKLSRLAQQKLSGAPVKERSGDLKSTIQHGTFVVKTPWGVIGSVGATGASKKLAILAGSVEYGSDHKARILKSLTGAKLRFKLPDGTIKFATRVSIPAFHIPEHSFLRSALRELDREIVADIGRAAKFRD